MVESGVSSTVDALSGDYVVTQTSYSFAIPPTNWGIPVKLQELGASLWSSGLGFRVQSLEFPKPLTLNLKP